MRAGPFLFSVMLNQGGIIAATRHFFCFKNSWHYSSSCSNVSKKKSKLLGMPKLRAAGLGWGVHGGVGKFVGSLG
jgi:hypothetical protein